MGTRTSERKPEPRRHDGGAPAASRSGTWTTPRATRSSSDSSASGTVSPTAEPSTGRALERATTRASPASSSKTTRVARSLPTVARTCSTTIWKRLRASRVVETARAISSAACRREARSRKLAHQARVRQDEGRLRGHGLERDAVAHVERRRLLGLDVEHAEGLAVDGERHASSERTATEPGM